MASISFSSLLNFSTSFPICVSSSSMFPAPSQKPCQPSKPKRRHVSKVECNGNPNNNPRNRRDILIGLGGLYGATSLSSNSAIAAPVSPPDPTNCVPATVPEPDLQCCPPSPVIDYQLPPVTTLIRKRQPAHLVSDEYIDKYKEAVRLMKALPLDDPRSFTQQANIHCAYCDGGYLQKGYPDREVNVHQSWLFAPFHRWYLYFYERILGSLIGDSTFALPFWNWDNPPGMEIPAFYTDKNSPLYDPLREASHQPPTIVDLNYDPDHDHSGGDREKQIQCNLITMYKQFVSGGKSPSLFHGLPYRAGCPPQPGYGTLETTHNHVHTWVGDSTQPYRKNMGILYAAARDPIFFAHHSNVDRIWNIWREIPGRRRRRDFTDDDWLESSFFFYDENKNYVRVKVEDSLDSQRMGYVYDNVDIPWLDVKFKPKKLVPDIRPKRLLKISTLEFPLILKSIARTTVRRPKPRTSDEGEKDEVLVIDIEYDRTEGVKFDVFINDEGDNQIGPDDSRFAGCFVTLPHSHVHENKINTSFRLEITDLLKDLEVKTDDSIAVTLLPKYGKKPVTIKGIKIKLVPVVEDENM